jgi:hypothetical protein
VLPWHLALVTNAVHYWGMVSIATVPRFTLLFSGHMIDAPGRKTPRFPPSMEAWVHKAIAQRLEAIGAASSDLGVCSAACGGDLIFAQAALARKVPLEIYLPFDVATFAQRSVEFANGDWRARFDAVLSASELHQQPTERPPLTEEQDPYEQANLWMLEAASRFGPDKIVFIALWDGKAGDGPGGTEHMMDTVRQHHGQVHWINTTKLWS